ncbi:hypothetical protein CYLTODRAFT_455370 [Cylindrobasidium torrendii FP15055 ss-10]|uniref:Uncharacterized protein n=1 Tax=Cylindrobasidium torrendii FP15055 ss-10 TaxID=1314674 RepID=A0A0D7B873_9AGAR|nr:hypothetical protein CYLTODRAFT_455370 [Cylindrobasidium torrendii FP15055 ss-10]
MAMTWQYLNREGAQILPWASRARILCVRMDRYEYDMPFPPTWLATKEELSRNSSSKLTTVTSAIDLVMKTIASQVALPAPSSKKKKVPEFPLPILNINDLPDDHPHSLRRCANLAFTSGYLSSEMCASEALVPILRGLLYVPGCCTSEYTFYILSVMLSLTEVRRDPDASCKYRTRETLFTSRMIIDGLPEKKWPLVTVALPRSWSDVNFAHDAQEATEALAHAFQPTLEFLLSLHRVIPGSDPTRLPKWFLLCGFYYTYQGIHVCSHRPVWDSDAGEWKLQSTGGARATREFLHSCDDIQKGRLIWALLMVQRCMYEVKQGISRWLSKYGEVFRAHGLLSS